MDINASELVVNGITYVPKGSEIPTVHTGDTKIVILQRGWIYIGKFTRENTDCKLTNAYCIRRWGTSKGLQELVNGPTSSTVLDKCEGLVEFDYLTVVHTISVNESRWNLG